MRRGKWQVKLRDGDDQDFLTGWHHYLKKRPGYRQYIKHRYQRRARKNARKLLQSEAKNLWQHHLHPAECQ